MDRLAAYGASGKGTVSAREILDLLEKMDFEYLKLEIPKAIKQSLDGAQRVNEIVGSLKDFSHADADGYVSVDCNLVMNDALVITRNVWKKAFTVSKEFDPELPRVEASQGELGQVFINLISNAVDAVSPGGEGAKHQLVLRSRRLEDGGVELSVSDDGPGIPASIQEKIFDPFYTTKSVGQGTGQGLYVSRKIVTERHQGRMFFASSPAGTTFFIQLPASQSKKISHQSVPESVSGSALPS
jgi:signal transduction histidine kinase